MTTPLPRILMLHNRYQFPGGEDASHEAEVALLQQFGHDVTVLERHNDDIRRVSGLGNLGLFAQTVWNKGGDRLVRRHLQQSSADLLHVQNFFPLWSPAVHTAARSLKIPTIQHLRNFRLACLNAYLLREGAICESCLGHNPWRGLRYRCYRQSFPQSLAVWTMVTTHRWRKTWHRDVDAFITPSRFAAKKLIQAGIPSDRLYIKPDFIPDPLSHGQIPPLPDRPTFVFIGRLTDQKGILLLLEAWRQLNQPDWQLDLIGEGDRTADCQRFISDHQLGNVHLHGQIAAPEVLRLIQSATAVVAPSQSYETFGRVVIEAFACGRAVLVANLGALPELVSEGETGFYVPHHEVAAWVERLRWTGEHPADVAEMGITARQVYEAGYTPAANYQQLMTIYRHVL